MTKRILYFMFASLLVFSAGSIHAQDDSLFVKILNESFEVNVGDTINVEAVFVDSNKVELDTIFTWSVLPAELGTIDSTGMFVAEAEGEGYIYAEFLGFKDSVEVEVELKDDDDDDDHEYPFLVIKPDEKELEVGETFQFKAVFVAGKDDKRDTTASWQIMDESVATVDTTGTVTAINEGETYLVVAEKKDKCK